MIVLRDRIRYVVLGSLISCILFARLSFGDGLANKSFSSRWASSITELLFGKKLGSHEHFGGLAYKVHTVETPDHAPLAIVEIEGNDGGEVVLLQPGFRETADVWDEWTVQLHKQGYKILISHVRGAGREDYQSGVSEESDNDLEDVLTKDTLTVWRFVQKWVGNKKFHVIGHSMGGLQILVALGNADPLVRQEFEESISTAQSVAGPSSMDAMAERSDIANFTGLPSKTIRLLLRSLHGIGVEMLSMEGTLFKRTKLVKEKGDVLSATLARVLERSMVNWVLLLVEDLLTHEGISTAREMRRFVRQEVSVFGIGLWEGWATAFIDKKFPVSFDPKNIRVPMQVISAEKDGLVSLNFDQRKLWRSLTNVPALRWIIVHKSNHADPVISAKINRALIPEAIKFMKNPQIGLSEPAIEIRLVSQLGSRELDCEARLMPKKFLERISDNDNVTDQAAISSEEE